ncbi:MAG TPA: phosphoribosylaminoimidazolesuccinocarboxamide synthase [Bacillota bacterium]|nr:phosphoribosylaminoimidazolesuccinocarboxamide synthase [Bacillota bacterium]
MQRLYQGKTKDVYEKDSNHVLLQFKDDVTGSDGSFDPGANTVGLTIPGSGQANVKFTKYFFEKLKEKQIPTHFVSANVEDASMIVKKAKMLGKGIEVIVRFYADGSFVRRYGDYCKKHDPLGGLIECTIKDDERGDPPILKDALITLGILTKDEYEKMMILTKDIATIVKNELAKRDVTLYDIKFEYGRKPETSELMLIDEISPGNMRVYRDQELIEPMELHNLFFGH